jgi:hypothetical protein
MNWGRILDILLFLGFILVLICAIIGGKDVLSFIFGIMTEG